MSPFSTPNFPIESATHADVSVDSFVSIHNASGPQRTGDRYSGDRNSGDRNSSIEASATATSSRVADRLEVSNYFRHKHRIDWWMTVGLSLVAMPVIAVTSLMILLVDGRPIFYRQIRVGLGGRPFKIWKFRTMRPDAEQATGAVWSRRRDPRVTRLGRWLRCCHLDELPQFFNILSGDMNLIGPRPERPEFVNELARDIPRYLRRTQVRPGITGLAQLRLGYDEQISEVGKKVALDLRYIRTASFRLDLSLLVWTAPYIIHQIANRAIGALQRWSGKGVSDEETVSLVSPLQRIDVSASGASQPHAAIVDQSSDSNSGATRRCSA